MNSPFAPAIERLDHQKQVFLAEVHRWPALDLAQVPVQGGWSALQVLEHLVLVESGILNRVASHKDEPHIIGMRDRAGTRFIDLLFRLPSRVSVPPSASAMIPGAPRTMPEIISAWDQTRMRLANDANAFPAGSRNGGVFRHPVAGWMTFAQVLRFFEAHVIHHGYQMKRIANGLPGGARR